MKGAYRWGGDQRRSCPLRNFVVDVFEPHGVLWVGVGSRRESEFDLNGACRLGVDSCRSEGEGEWLMDEISIHIKQHN